MSKDFRFNKKEYGFDVSPVETVESFKQTKTKRFMAPPKPKSTFERFDKRA